VSAGPWPQTRWLGPNQPVIDRYRPGYRQRRRPDRSARIPLPKRHSARKPRGMGPWLWSRRSRVRVPSLTLLPSETACRLGRSREGNRPRCPDLERVLRPEGHAFNGYAVSTEQGTVLVDPPRSGRGRLGDLRSVRAVRRCVAHEPQPQPGGRGVSRALWADGVGPRGGFRPVALRRPAAAQRREGQAERACGEPWPLILQGGTGPPGPAAGHVRSDEVRWRRRFLLSR
jgi:hypothetical protein